MSAEVRLETFDSAQERPGLLDDLHALCVRAFEGDFDPEDWEHAIGGTHFVAFLADRPVSHASVVPRTIFVDETPFDSGYVEAVATETEFQGRGLGTRVMREATRVIRTAFDLGALGTGEHGFYERLGWERWAGPSYVRTAAGLSRSEDDDDGIMVLRFGPSATIRLTGSISCEGRSGDDW